MANTYTFPRTEYQLEDRSMREVIPVPDLSLHRPLFFGFAEQGRINEPVYGTISELRQEFGESTFNIGSDYFNHSTLFATSCLTKNKIFFVRVADEDATIGTMAIVMEVYVDGAKVYLKHRRMSIADIRTAAGEESLRYDNLKNVNWTVTTTIGSNVVEGTAYVLVGASFGTAGKIANQSGFDLFYDDTFDAQRQRQMQAVVYQIGYVQKPLGEDVTLPIRNTFNSAFSGFVARKGAIDSLTTKEYYFDEVMKSGFRTTMKPPFPTVLYSDNFEKIGKIVLAKEPTLDQDKPYLVNLITGKDFDGHDYPNTTILDSDTDLIQGTHQWFIGGDDGALDNDTFEGLVRAWLTGSIYPDIIDAPRYPITHIYDSGYEVDTKYKIIDFMNFRKQVKVSVATHVSGDISFTKEEDLSMLSSLRSRMLSQPESTVYGTGACRGEIIQHSGELIDSKWNARVAGTYEIMMKRADAHNAIFVKHVPKGLPWSQITYLKNLNWTATEADHKEISWQYAGNYFQYYSMSDIHYADIRSIYEYSNSLLSDSILVDYLVYSMYMCHEVWAKYAGKTLPTAELQSKVKKELDDKFQKAFGSFVSMTANPILTAQDIDNGDSITVQIEVAGLNTFRTMFIHQYVVRNTVTAAAA